MIDKKAWNSSFWYRVIQNLGPLSANKTAGHWVKLDIFHRNIFQMKKICAVWVCGNVSNRFYSFHFSSFITLDKIPGTFGWGQKTTWTSHKILIDWFFCRYYLLLECLSVFDEISPTGDQSELFLSLKLLKCGRRMVKIVFSRIAIELKIEKFVYILITIHFCMGLLDHSSSL